MGGKDRASGERKKYGFRIDRNAPQPWFTIADSETKFPIRLELTTQYFVRTRAQIEEPFQHAETYTVCRDSGMQKLTSDTNDGVYEVTFIFTQVADPSGKKMY